ncbi:MAG: hypothetical protein ABIP53_07545, partial [Candidatus Limnocylindrales bacterium]
RDVGQHVLPDPPDGHRLGPQLDRSDARRHAAYEPGHAGYPADRHRPHSRWHARASTGRNIRIAFQRNSSPWTTYFERSVSISTGRVRYTVRFTPSVSSSSALFNFNLGARGGTVWLDEVSLTR